jgi:hypothetical protein
MDGKLMAEEVKQPETAVAVESPHWNKDELVKTMKQRYGGEPIKPIIDQTPDRGTGWMGKR